MSHRVAAVCYACSPIRSSEPEMSWRWISSLQHAGCEVVAFTSSRYQADFGADGQDAIVRDGVEIRFVEPPKELPSPVPGPASGWYRYVGWQRRMLDEAKRLHAVQPFDVAHHFSYGSATQGFRIDGLGIPTVLGPVGGAQFPPSSFRREFPRTWKSETARKLAVHALLASPLRRRQLRGLDHTFVANPETGAALERFGVDTELMLDTGSVVESIADQPWEPAGVVFRLAWVGRVFEIKALGLALDAIELAATRTAVSLEICGDGPDLERHRSKIEELQTLGVVNFRGFVGQEELASVYDSMDSLLYTSLRDNGGEPLHRAMERGRPPIVFAHQGPGAVVADDCGLRVSVTDRAAAVEEFATAIVDLACDPERYRALSAGAIRQSKANTWPQRAARAVEVYDRLARDSRGVRDSQ